jgi:hypothetical protein
MTTGTSTASNAAPAIRKWNDNTPGVLTYLNKHELQIDSQYQRELSQHRVDQIKEAWSWLACGVLLVAERKPGEFYVFDGQTRLSAARELRNIDEMPCLVFKLDDVPAEAMAFFRANCVRGPVSMFDKVHALVVAGDRITIDALDLMRKHGYQPSRSGAEDGVSALGTYMRFFKSERDLFTKVFPLVTELHDHRPIQERQLTAIMYIAKYGEPSAHSKEGRARLLELGYDAIAGSIARSAAAFSKGGARIFAQGVIDLMNKGRRKNTFRLRNADTDGEAT